MCLQQRNTSPTRRGRLWHQAETRGQSKRSTFPLRGRHTRVPLQRGWLSGTTTSCKEETFAVQTVTCGKKKKICLPRTASGFPAQRLPVRGCTPFHFKKSRVAGPKQHTLPYSEWLPVQRLPLRRRLLHFKKARVANAKEHTPHCGAGLCASENAECQS